MKLLSTAGAIALALPSLVSAAGSWSFTEATLSVATKGEEVVKHKLTPSAPLASPVALTPATTLKLLLKTTDEDNGKRPNQAFLTLHEHDTGLEESFAFALKSDGKGKVEVSPKDLPFQFLSSSKSLSASIVIGSFGGSTPYNSQAFDIAVQPDPHAPASIPSPPERFAAKPEIHHIFRADPRSPPKLISIVFSLAILAALPVLLGAWLVLGGNVAHAAKALGSSPVSHALFFGSIVAMEGVFAMYYVNWTLFQTLPAVAVVGLVAFVSGSKALTEVQERRLAGLR